LFREIGRAEEHLAVVGSKPELQATVDPARVDVGLPDLLARIGSRPKSLPSLLPPTPRRCVSRGRALRFFTSFGCWPNPCRARSDLRALAVAFEIGTGKSAGTTVDQPYRSGAPHA